MGINFIINLFILAEYDVIIVMIDAYIKIVYFKSVMLKGFIKEKWVNIVNAVKIIRHCIFC